MNPFQSLMNFCNIASSPFASLRRIEPFSINPEEKFFQSVFSRKIAFPITNLVCFFDPEK